MKYERAIWEVYHIDINSVFDSLRLNVDLQWSYINHTSQVVPKRICVSQLRLSEGSGGFPTAAAFASAIHDIATPKKQKSETPQE